MGAASGELKAAVSERRALGAAASGTALALAIFLSEAWGRRTPIDDAFISYRYAQNLVEGLGLVYNPGEYVEGFTNLLWTLWIAAAVACGIPAPAAGHALGLASGAAALAASALLAARLVGPCAPVLAAAAPPLVLAAPVFTRWSFSGLETPLFVAWNAAALAAYAHRRVGLATSLAVLATWTRPEGVLVAAAIFAFHCLPRWRQARAWRAPLAYAAALLLLCAFRLLYYGSLLPNTFYAKVGGVPLSHGVEHVLAFFGSGAWLLLPGAGVAVALEPRSRPGALHAALVVAAVVAVGGDVFRWRFLLPLLPWLAAAAAAGTARIWRRSPAAGAGAVAALVVAAWLQSVGPLPRSLAEAGSALLHPERARYLDEVVRVDRVLEATGRLQASSLLASDERLGLVATGAIGAFGYYSRLRILDLYGLVDPVIARSPRPGASVGDPVVVGHQRSRAAYVLARRPDLILLDAPQAGVAPLIPAIRDLRAHPAFERLYVFDEELGFYRLRPQPAATEGGPR